MYGNPFKIDTSIRGLELGLDAKGVVEKYRDYLKYHPLGRAIALISKDELRGKNLACFCALDQPCHADVLLEVANS